MITCNLMGGLGNQIFQIFTTISYAIQSKNQFVFLNLHTLGGGSTTLRYTFWNTFFSKLHPFLIAEFPHNNEVIREQNYSYNKLPVSQMINKNVILHGYFQSYKYFQKYYSTICKIIQLDNMKETLLLKLNLSNEYLQNVVSMHFRIGDYKKIQQYHPLATYEYYDRAIKHIQQMAPVNNDTKLEFLYFCEDTDIDDVLIIINKLQNKYSKHLFTRKTNSLEDWEQMLLMSCCHHNIIANSSFSWWSAYFNSYTDKIVCYPSVWFGELAGHNTKDLCPPEWNKIDV